MKQSDLAHLAAPESVLEYVSHNAPAVRMAAHQHEAGGEAIRETAYRGHRIVIGTSYRIEVDGRPLDIPLRVGNNGRVHYHALPNYAPPSAVDVVKRVIDAFPQEFPPPDAESASPTQEVEAHHGGNPS